MRRQRGLAKADRVAEKQYGDEEHGPTGRPSVGEQAHDNGISDSGYKCHDSEVRAVMVSVWWVGGVRLQNRLIEASMSSADLTHRNGFGLLLTVSM